MSALRSPLLVAAFEGWNDAGDAASGAVEHLVDVWHGEQVAEVDPDDFYDFQVNRPTVSLIDGVTRQITWPTSRFFAVRLPSAPRDLVLVRGVEPNMRWRGFCAELLRLAGELGVSEVATLGALLADSPHTRPVPVTGTSSDPALAARLGLEPSRYEGPTGIVGVLGEACSRAGLPAVSFWAAVPHYVASPPCPKATIALLQRLEDLLDVAVPLGELPEAARDWEQHVDELAAEDSDVAEYVASLEEREDQAELPGATGEAIAAEFQRFLRRQDGGS